MRRIVLSLLFPLLVFACVPTTPAPTAVPSLPELHLLLYDLETAAVAKPVAYTTQFGTDQAELGKLLFLAEPTFKSLDPLNPPSRPNVLPLSCWAFPKAPPADKTVMLDDQFSARWAPRAKYKVYEPFVLCDPVRQKIRDGRSEPWPRYPTPLVLYRIEGAGLSEAVPVSTRDQFRTQKFSVKTPVYLADPALKNGSGDRKAVRPLKCYIVNDAAESGAKAEIVDQFGTHGIRIGKPLYFCVPADKKHVDAQ